MNVSPRPIEKSTSHDPSVDASVPALPRTESADSSPGSSAASPMSSASLFMAFVKIGATSFGMPSILHNVRTYAAKQGVGTAREVDEGLALVQLYPGPIMANLVTFVGHRQRGNAGAFAATAGFLLPSLLAMLAAAAAFQRYGGQPGVKALLWSLNAVVVGTVLNITLDHGKKHLGNPVQILLAVLAGVIALSGINLLWAVAAGFVAGANMQRRPLGLPIARRPAPLQFQGLAVPLVLVAGLASVAVFSLLNPSPLGNVTAAFMKIGSVAFGNGYTILPMIQKVAVVEHHWLSASQLGAAIGIGQFTPGPILNVATFVGFMAAGVVGALVASIAIYAPSFVMTLFLAGAYQRLRHLDWIQGAIGGVLAAFVGMLVMVLVRLGEHALTGPFAVAVAALAFVALRYLKWSLPLIYLVVGAAVVAWSARSLVGG